jgi:hypothetical protein
MAAIVKRSAWQTLKAESSVTYAKGAFGAESDTIASMSGLSDSEKAYPVARLKITVTYSGDPGDNSMIDVYERPSDGSTKATVPDADNLQHYLTSFQTDNDGTDLTQELFTRWVGAFDRDSTFYLRNQSVNSVNITAYTFAIQMGSFE